MKRPDPPSDRDIQEAFRALDRTIPDGHLDDFSSRVLARLDEPEVGGMDSRELAQGSGVSRPNEVALGAAATSNEANVTPAREENSGLHEIKALASTTKRRISQRVTSEAEAEESLLVGATSGSFRAAALPDPAHEVSSASESASMRVGRPVVARPASEVDRRSMPRSSSVPFWVLGGVATAAAAAAVAVFVFGVGRGKKDQELATSASDGEVVARASGTASAASEPAAVGSASSGDMKFAEPPPAEQPAAPGAAPAASAPATIALADTEPEKKAEEDQTAEGGARRLGRADGKGNGDRDASKKDPARTSTQKDKESKKTAPPTGKGSAGSSQGGKDLNDVLDEVTGGVKAPATPVQEEGPKKPSKKGLDRGDVSKAMGAVRSQVMHCRDKEQFEGTVTVKFQVAPSGEVTSAVATGSKAGTPTGACVAAAVKKAKFPAFDGASTSFTYPFLLAE